MRTQFQMYILLKTKRDIVISKLNKKCHLVILQSAAYTFVHPFITILTTSHLSIMLYCVDSANNSSIQIFQFLY